MIEILTQYFPKHRIIISDFNSLPESIVGVDAPVVQTRFENAMIPCTTYLVQPGYFDIFFPTNFELLKAVYQQVNPGKKVEILSHANFLKIYGDLPATTTTSGDNPMLQYYENVSFIVSS